MDTPEDLGSRLGANVRSLRESRSLTQAQLAKLSGLPRATWANIESGTSNPTLAVLTRLARALAVSLEELLAVQRAGEALYPRGTLPEVIRGAARIRKLLPDKVPAAEIDRIELPPGARMSGIPHTPGTREYLACETGVFVLSASGRSWQLAPGDVMAFRGDQKHGYTNPGEITAVGYSVVLLAP